MAYIMRELEKKILPWIDNKEILAIRGPRQCGKTTLLRRIKEILLARSIEEKKIIYVNFEDDLEKLKFESNPKEFISFKISSVDKHYFLFDEVQVVKEAGKILKLLFDTFTDVKFIITGSSSFDLTSLGASLVGRVIFFTMYPLSFGEFLSTKGEQYHELYKKMKIDLNGELKIEETVFLNDLNKFLEEFLTFGSYPAVVLEPDREKKKEILKNLFTTYIEKDIVVLYGIRQREHVVKLLKTIASVTGQSINYETLIEHSGLNYKEVKEYLPLLEDSFVISLVRPFHKNLINELRKNPKIYFIDAGIRNYLFEQFDNINFDFLYESFIHNQLMRVNKVKYWRTANKTEVDFVVEKEGKLIPIEVKITPKITRSFRSFLSHYKPEKAFIANLNKAEKISIENCTVFILPFTYF